MSFESDIERFIAKVERRRHEVFVNVATETLRSVQEGHPVTGAPGQPVDTGVLKASWHLEFESATTALISTNVIYAPNIEDLIGPYGPIQIRSPVGGGHSVKLTRANFPRLVNTVARDVVGNDP